MASAAEYGDFPVVNYNEYRLVTGTIKYNVDVISAINACVQLGYEHSDIIIDYVLGSGKEVEKVDTDGYTTIKAVYRYMLIHGFYAAMDTIQNAKYFFADVNFRAEVTPSRTLADSAWIYDFNQDNFLEDLILGERDSKAEVTKYQAKNQ